MSKIDKSICGIIMPISKSDDDHPTTHWEKVKDIISEAIEKAGCEPQPVWEGGAHDIIQSKILQNIYENPVVVCDLSTRNPNVMLEIGMRLTTKKPTLLIAEEGTPLPFDTGIIQTEFYDPNLEYRTIQTFIKKLSDQIGEKLKAHEAGEYHPYLEAFEFETVEPPRVSVTSEEHLAEMVGEIRADLARLQRSVNRESDYAAAMAKWSRRKGFSPAEFLSDDELAAITIPSQSPSSQDRLSGIRDVGSEVFHKKFGRGTVIDVEDNKITVDFPKAGKRRVLDSFLEWPDKGAGKHDFL